MQDGLFFIRAVDAVRTPQIRIYKSQRMLELCDGGSTVARIRLALGRGEGPKAAEGDLKTPEGRYYVCVRNDKSKFHLSIGISYPNADDARCALAAGRITPEQCAAIVEANRMRVRPPWDTGLGGEIMIHGGGSSRDWTAGCIALDDEHMDFLWEFVPIGTDVVIVP